MKVLVATVGGKPAPIETAIRDLHPSHVTLICSASTSKIADGLIEQVQASGGSAEKSEVAPDDFAGCYTLSRTLLSQLRDAYPEGNIYADYTGGTKSMSAALVAAAMDTSGVTLSLVTGSRDNIVSVVNGTQALRAVQADIVIAGRLREAAGEAFRSYDYPTTISLLRDALRRPGLPNDMSDELQCWLTLALALDRWDRFQHRDAWSLLYHYRRCLTGLVCFLRAVMWSRSCAGVPFSCEGLEGIGKTPKGHGYELVDDLLLSADRRASREMYDEAVARLYRATELFAQIRLRREYRIDTGDVDLDSSKLPPDVVDWLRGVASPLRKKVQLGLVQAYELLAMLNRDGTEPLGALYDSKYRERIRDFLNLRNDSLLAHGCKPLSRSDWEWGRDFFASFLQEAHAAIGLKAYASPLQFPTTCEPVLARR